MPDFDWNSFAEQVSTIRNSAQERLGDRFEALAGQSHQYDNVTKGLLEKYICAGSPFDGETEASGAGEYSEITKAADLYFDLECFNFPTILVDTPGVNDPFLVRDEITRQNLELADIYVVVLTARQPLSRADLNLLRLLKGLNKERIIVFVNKADELEMIGEHAPEIISRIQDLLAQELRLEIVPVILGSALWAKTALSGSKDEVGERLASSDSLAGSSAAATLDTSGSFWLDDASEREVKAEALLTRAGTPALAAALSDLMQSGHIPKVIDGVEGMLLTIAKNEAAIAGRHARIIEELLQQLDRAPEAARDPALFHGKVEPIRNIREELADRIDRLEREVSSLSQDLSVRLRSRLRALVTSFAHNSGLKVTEHRKRANTVPWRCNTLQLRCDLEAEMSESLSRLQSDMTGLQETTARDLRKSLRRAAGDLGVTLIGGPLPFRGLSPRLAALGGMVAVDPDSPVWAEWWSRTMPIEERVKHLRDVIEVEFGGICEELAAAADRDVRDLAAYILTHLRIVIFAPLQGWHERAERLTDALNSTDIAAALEADLRDSRDREAKCGALAAAMRSGASE